MILQFSSHKVLMGEALYPFICILFLFSILAFSGPRNDRFLSSKILKYIAELSYSLYLTHNFCINLAEKFITDSENSYRTLYSTGIAIVLALIAAHILNRFFERPLRDFGRRIARG
jgi:peptidoglycan/LPS O-acetylase OafA/YrhL